MFSLLNVNRIHLPVFKVSVSKSRTGIVLAISHPPFGHKMPFVDVAQTDNRRNGARRVAAICISCIGIVLTGIAGASSAEPSNQRRAWEGTIVGGAAVGRACFWPDGARVPVRIAVQRADQRSGIVGVLDIGGLVVARIAGPDETRANLYAPLPQAADAVGALVIDISEGSFSIAIGTHCRIAQARLALDELSEPHASSMYATLDGRLEFAAALAEAGELGEKGEPKRSITLAASTLGITGSPPSREAIELAMRSRGPVLASLGALMLANTWLDISEVSNAEPVVDVADTVLSETLPTGHPALLYVAYLRARMLAIRGRWDEAAALHERILSQQRAVLPGESADVLATQIGLAAQLYNLGDLGRARALLEQATRTAQRVLGEDNMITANAEVNLAGIMGYMGEHEAARQELLRMFQAVTNATPKMNGMQARLLWSYALASSDAGRMQDARAAIERAAAWHASELGMENLRTLAALELQAWIYGQSERIGEAIVLQRRVLEHYVRILGSNHPVSIRARENLGWWYVRDGRVAEATPLLHSVYEAASKRYGENDRRSLDAAVDAAYADFLGGDMSKGCALFATTALRPGGDPPQNEAPRINALFGLGRCQLAAANPTAAMATFGQVLDYRRRTLAAQSEATLAALASYARAQLQAGDRSGALTSLQSFVADTEAMRSAEAPQASGGRASFANQVAGKDYQAGYHDLALLYAEGGRVTDAIRVTESARARGIIDALSMRAASRDTLVPERDRLQLHRLDEQLKDVEAEIALTSAASVRRASLAVQRDAVATELKRAEQRLTKSARNRSGGDRLDLKHIRRHLSPGTVIVGYQMVRERAWVYLLRRDAEPRVVLLPTPPDVGNTVSVLHTGLGTPNAALAPIWRLGDGRLLGGLARPAADATRISADDVARSLAATLLEPLARELTGAKRLIIAADGPLALLPFEVLPFRGRLLIDRVDVSYVPSLAVWQALQVAPRRARRPTTELIAFGAPAYASPEPTTERATPLTGRHWSPLPGAAREVAAVAAMFPAARQRIYLGAEASEANFHALNRSGALANARYLLLAVHGVLSPAAPQWSALIMSEANRNMEPNGFVTSAELATYELGSELTVLSACETGLGKEVAGEGIFGLPFALFVAGSRKTVLTLWPVADEATAQFVERLFAKLKRGIAPAQALAATKREFRRDPRYSAPFYWAPFVLYGD